MEKKKAIDDERAAIIDLADEFQKKEWGLEDSLILEFFCPGPRKKKIKLPDLPHFPELTLRI